MMKTPVRKFWLRSVATVAAVASTLTVLTVTSSAAQADTANTATSAAYASAPSSVTFRRSGAAADDGAVAASGNVIVCTAKADDVHRSSSTHLPNVHGRISCDNYMPSISINVAILRNGTQVGNSGTKVGTGRNLMESTSNATSCVTANYRGEAYGHVVAPAGFSPSSADIYGAGPTGYINCAGGCGTDATPATTSGAQTDAIEPDC